MRRKGPTSLVVFGLVGIAILLGGGMGFVMLQRTESTLIESPKVARRDEPSSTTKKPPVDTPERQSSADHPATADMDVLAEERKGPEGRSNETRTSDGLFQTDPLSSYQAFCKDFIAQTDRQESVPGRHTMYQRQHGLPAARSIVYRVASSDYSIDLQRTNSLVSPRVGTLDVFITTIVDGSEETVHEPFRFTFAAQNDKWTLTEIRSYSSTLGSWCVSMDGDSSMAYFRNVMLSISDR